MTLQWRAAAPTGRDLVASGQQGRYRIIAVGRHFRLTGVGRDGMEMLALPTGGMVFDNQTAARAKAARVDRAPVGEFSGA